MKTKLLIFLLLNVTFFINSFAQSFQSESSVLTYASGKVFSNTDKTVKIEITYDGIKVNGNLAYFNLKITVVNSSIATIKGYSLSNPDGTILFSLNNSTGCIVQGSDSYCVLASNQNTTIDNSSTSNKFTSILPKSFFATENNIEWTLSLNKNGIGTMKMGNISDYEITWSITDDNVLKIFNGGSSPWYTFQINFDYTDSPYLLKATNGSGLWDVKN
jgi:hypothetical protein